MQTEARVRTVFLHLGFRVEQISVEGRQIDLVATRQELSIEPEVWVIEITNEYVNVDKGSKDSQKLLLAHARFPGSRMMLVSLKGFTDDQRATLKALKILPLRYDELENRKVDLGMYASLTVDALSRKKDGDIGFDSTVFVEPDVQVQTGAASTDRALQPATEGPDRINHFKFARAAG